MQLKYKPTNTGSQHELIEVLYEIQYQVYICHILTLGPNARTRLKYKREKANMNISKSIQY